MRSKKETTKLFQQIAEQDRKSFAKIEGSVNGGISQIVKLRAENANLREIIQQMPLNHNRGRT